MGIASTATPVGAWAINIQPNWIDTPVARGQSRTL